MGSGCVMKRFKKLDMWWDGTYIVFENVTMDDIECIHEQLICEGLHSPITNRK